MWSLELQDTYENSATNYSEASYHATWDTQQKETTYQNYDIIR